MIAWLGPVLHIIQAALIRVTRYYKINTYVNDCQITNKKTLQIVTISLVSILEFIIAVDTQQIDLRVVSQEISRFAWIKAIAMLYNGYTLRITLNFITWVPLETKTMWLIPFLPHYDYHATVTPQLKIIHRSVIKVVD